MLGTETPDNVFDKIGHGELAFYKLNAEAFLMGSGASFTILKPCGLTDGAPAKNKIVVGHDGKGFSLALDHRVPRADVARLAVAALEMPEKGRNLRFDMCTSPFGQPQSDLGEVLQAARYPWDETAAPAGP